MKKNLKIKKLLKNGIGELKLNNKYHLFVELEEEWCFGEKESEYLLIELFDTEDMVCNGLELLQHNLTKNDSVNELKQYGLALIKEYERNSDYNQIITKGEQL